MNQDLIVGVLIGLVIGCLIQFYLFSKPPYCNVYKRSVVKNEDRDRVYSSFSKSASYPQLIYSEPIYFCKKEIVESIIISGKYDSGSLKVKMHQKIRNGINLSLEGVRDSLISDESLELVFEIKIVEGSDQIKDTATIDTDLSVRTIIGDLEFINELERSVPQNLVSQIEVKLTPKVCDFYVVP